MFALPNPQKFSALQNPHYAEQPFCLLPDCYSLRCLLWTPFPHASRLKPPAPTPGPGCPPGYVLVTAGLLGTLLDFATGAAVEDAKFGFLRSANLERVVLLAHSAGGSVAMHMLSGDCMPLQLAANSSLA